MCSGGNTRALPRVGFPIRRSRDQRLVSTSPGLFAATHVLHRLLAPRHPPRALILLIEKNTLFVAAMEFSRCARAGARKETASLAFRPVAGPSKLSSARMPCFLAVCHQHDVEVDIAFLEKLPRKEVIQPQLPLRLPCYDFTPVTDPTFDGSLPCGLGHRLRVLPASVV